MSELQECYEKMSRECGIKEGDVVRILRKAEDFELGWENGWISPTMDQFVGRDFTVNNVNHSRGISLDGSVFSFPFFVLELVWKRKKIDLSDLEVVKELNREVWDWLAEDPKSRRKYEWPGWKRNGGDIPDVQNLCFLCEYADLDCSKCPGNWSDYSIIHNNYSNAPCECGEYGFYLNRSKVDEFVLERIYKRIANICD